MNPYTDLYLLIGESRIHATAAGYLPVIDPSTEAVIGQLPIATADHLEAAARAASAGFADWAARSAFERSAVLRRAASLLRERNEDLARLMSLELGKPIAQSRLEWISSAEALEWAAEEGRRTYGRVIPSRNPAVSQVVSKVPVGPVAAFAPWNFPAWAVMQKVAPALAAGCSVVLKPAEETPGSALAIAEALVDAGLPPGVLNVVYGIPAEISDFLIRHDSIRKITFTGSVPVGRKLSALAGEYLKRTTMELGGHGPVIIAADADIERAAKLAAAAKFRNAGQVCVAPTRFLVEGAAAARFAELLAEETKTIILGDGVDETATMGPVVNERRRQAMEGFVDDALAKGAILKAGGARLNRPGYFYQPTVLADVPLHASAMTEEVFGPIALVCAVPDIDSAIDVANSLPFGLGSYAFTQSATTARKVADRIRAGMLGINHFQLAAAETPFGGVRDSGFGSEGGIEGIAAYLDTKYVTHMVV